MKKSNILTFVFAMVVAGVALAGDLTDDSISELSKVNTLAESLLKWVQGIALLGGAISLVFAGYTISTGSSEGTNKLKAAIIGLVVCAAAVAIAQFVKSNIL